MFDIHELMKHLSQERPIFHSEADFQHAFAWQFHTLFPDATVRLEYPIDLTKRIHLDLLLTFSNHQRLAVELKYRTCYFNSTHRGEVFALKDHSARDLGRYGVWKDVSRIEQLVMANQPNMRGYTVFLTNTDLYWKPGTRVTNDKDFHLHDGRTVQGDLSWQPIAPEYTLSLSHTYTVTWHPYSVLSPEWGGEFRYLVFEV